MKSVKELIRSHDAYIDASRGDPGFPARHATRIAMLQHERLAHLITMFAVIIIDVLFLGLYLQHDSVLLCAVFGILCALSTFYVAHYYTLENTLIRWYGVSGTDDGK
ncbi:MAG TPA: hypothetical protein PKJ16_13850 [Spirochaetota bacterium]|nr:hypothetical protein [Spirochaetota bacterium]HPU87027.1 hypothetical protein [Spirochaetota bacterium]